MKRPGNYAAFGGQFHIPPYMEDTILDYVLRGEIDRGDLLYAVVRNDLKESVARADDTNVRNLPAYVLWFYNEVPSQCWGSKEKVEAWCEARRANPLVARVVGNVIEVSL